MIDIAIIGGGIVGIRCLQEALKRFPGKKIQVFDQGKIGSGSSHFSAGLCSPLARNEIVADLLKDNLEVDSAHQYLLPTYFVVNQSQVDQFKSQYIANGLELTDASVMQQYFPDLQLAPNQLIFRGFHTHRADVPALIQSAMTDLPSNVQIKEETEVLDLMAVDYGVSLKTNQGDFHAKKAIVATGPWCESPQLRNKKIVAFHLSDIPVDEQAPVIIFTDNDAFLMPMPEHKQWLLSFTCQEWDVQPTDSFEITDQNRETMHRAMASVIPDSIRKVSGGRVFCDAYVKNPEKNGPLISPLNSFNNSVIVCAGFSGSGYRLSCGAAKKAVELLRVEA